MSTRTKHIPMRTCVVCRNKMDKRELTRLVCNSGHIVIDETGKQDGRGAYICSQPECWQKVVSTDVLSKALRTKITAENREELSDMMLTRHPVMR